MVKLAEAEGLGPVGEAMRAGLETHLEIVPVTAKIAAVLTC